MPTDITDKNQSRIQKSPEICGGDACIRATRIPVWSIIRAMQLGTIEQDLYSYFVTPLTDVDIRAAVAYYQENRDEIEDEIRKNEEA